MTIQEGSKSILVDSGFELVAMTEPRKANNQAGAETRIFSSKVVASAPGRSDVAHEDYWCHILAEWNSAGQLFQPGEQSPRRQQLLHRADTSVRGAGRHVCRRNRLPQRSRGGRLADLLGWRRQSGWNDRGGQLSARAAPLGVDQVDAACRGRRGPPRAMALK
jgi:hypothetical protein